MTEEQAKSELFKIHKEYMRHTPKERVKLYTEYVERRNKVKEALSNLMSSRKLELLKTK